MVHFPTNGDKPIDTNGYMSHFLISNPTHDFRCHVVTKADQFLHQTWPSIKPSGLLNQWDYCQTSSDIIRGFLTLSPKKIMSRHISIPESKLQQPLRAPSKMATLIISDASKVRKKSFPKSLQEW